MYIDKYTISSPYSGIREIRKGATVEGFANNQTKFNGENWDANGTIKAKAPQEITDIDVRDFVFDNRDKIFTRLPNISNTDITISSKSKTGDKTIRTTFSIPVYRTSDSSTTRESYTININNLTIKNTSIKNNRQWNGSDFLINVYASSLNETIIKQKIESTPNFRSKLFDNYPEEFTITSISNLIKGDGFVTFNLRMSRIYWNNVSSTNIDDCTWTNLKLVNLPKPTTKLKMTVSTNGIAASGTFATKAPYEVNDTDLISFIYNNRTSIFDDLPTISSTDVVINSKTTNKSTELTEVKFTIPSFTNSEIKASKQWTIRITNFTNKDTSPKNSARTWSADTFSIDIPSRDIDAEYLKTKLNNTLNFRNILFNNYPDNFVIKNILIKEKTVKTVKFDLEMDQVYWNGRHSVDKSDCTWGNFIINNIREYVTYVKETIKTNGIATSGTLTSKAPYEATDDELKEFVFNNRTAIFDNIPNISSSSEITITAKKSSGLPSAIYIDLTIPSYINDSLQIQPKSFSIKLTNFTNKDTSLTNNKIWDSTLFNINEPVWGMSDEYLLNQIRQNSNFRSILFNNYPTSFQSQSVRITSRSSTNRTITFDLTTSSAYRNGVLSSSPQDCLFTGLTFTNIPEYNTSMKSSIATSGINASDNIILKAPYELTDIDLKEFIFKNKNNIFDKLPSSVATSNIGIKQKNIIDSTTIDLIIEVDSYTNNTSTTFKKTYSLRINNLKNKDTILKKQSFMANEVNIEKNVRDINEDTIKTINIESLLSNYSKYSIIKETQILNRTGNKISGYQIEFNIILDRVYKNGKETSEYNDCIFRNIKITNIGEKTTEVKSSAYTAGLEFKNTTKNSYETTDDEILSFIFKERFNIFDNLDKDFSEKDIEIIRRQEDNGTSMHVDLKIQCYPDGISNYKESKTFSGILIKGFKLKKTIINNNVKINEDVFRDKRFDEITEDDLRDYVISKNNISNLPLNFTKNDIEIKIKEYDSSLSSLSTKIILKKYYDNDGKLVENGSLSKDVVFSIYEYNTKPKEEKSLFDDLTLYIMIGAGALLLLIILLIIIIIIKKKNKAKKTRNIDRSLPRSGGPSRGPKMLAGPSAQQTRGVPSRPASTAGMPPRPSVKPGTPSVKPGSPKVAVKPSINRPVGPTPAKVTLKNPNQSFAPKIKK